MKIVVKRRALSLALALTLALTVALLLLLSGLAGAHDEPGASRTIVSLSNGSGSAPVMQSIDPVSNTHTAPLTTSVSITYDQPMSPTVVSTRTFAVHAMQTGLLSQTYGVQVGTIALTPTSALKPGELVQVSATTGTVNITGTEPLSPTVWQFRAEALGGSGRLELRNNVGPGTNLTEDLALGDLDGDGHLDLAVVNSGLSEVYLGNGDGTFGTGLKFGGDANWNCVALGDLDGDSDLDIARCKQTGCRVCLNEGTVPYSTTCTAYGTCNTLDVGLGDLDGDGDLDMVMANWGFRDSVRFNDGDGVFDTVSRFGPSSGDPSGSDSVALGDLDGDSDLDVVIGYRDGTFVYLNNGDGTSLGTGTGVGPADIQTLSVALGDVDGDGDLDMITGRYEASNLVLLNDGDGSFDTTTYPLAEASNRTFSAALGDLDGDGDLDVVVGNLNQQNKVFLNDGDGTFDTTMYELGPHGDGTHAVALGDVDGDGDLDAAVGNMGQNAVFLNRRWHIYLPMIIQNH